MRRSRFWLWMSIGLVVLGFGALFLVLGLENADHVSSGIGAAASMLGLRLTAFVAHRGRPARASGASTDMRVTATDQARVYQVGPGGVQNITEH